VDERGAAALAEQRHSVGVAAERADVLLDPVQRGNHVQQSVVARRVTVARAEETCTTHADIHSFTHTLRVTSHATATRCSFAVRELLKSPLPPLLRLTNGVVLSSFSHQMALLVISLACRLADRRPTAFVRELDNMPSAAGH